MSGYPYYGGNPQYPAPQNQIYPQVYNAAQAPIPGVPAPAPVPSYPTGQTPQYPFHPGFAVYPTPTVQPAQLGQPLVQPTALSYSYSGPPSFPSSHNVPIGAGVAQPSFESVIEWVPSSTSIAHTLSNRALVGGYEGYDKSPLWVIRSRYEGDLIPGKLAVNHQVAYVPWGGKEVLVHNVEICCVKPDKIRWVPCSGNVIPPNAVIGGNTSSGEPLYIGRAREQGSLTPGKVHPSHKVLYISFGGKEVPHRSYEILCTV